jgi:hypothetical protein
MSAKCLESKVNVYSIGFKNQGPRNLKINSSEIMPLEIASKRRKNQKTTRKTSHFFVKKHDIDPLLFGSPVNL